jgi:hypothetical protein
MFVRFVAKSRLPGSRCRAGVFYVADLAEERGDLAWLDQLRCDLACSWFDLHLPFPRRFSRSRRPNAHPAAICWFKADARECIQRARRMAALLNLAGVPIDMLRTHQPGYVVYEDSFQVVAVPFRDTRA